MKKEQKVIEINIEKKIKLANERAEYAEHLEGFAFERYSVKNECAELLRGVTDENKRGDILANRAAKIARIEMRERDCEARHRRKVAMILLSAADKIKAAEDDPEPETDNEKDNDVTVKGFLPQQQTVYIDGSEHSARIVARRLINKMPHIPKDGYLFVHVIRDDDGDFFVSVSASGKSPDANIVKIFSKGTHNAESEAEFVEEARKMLTIYEDNNNSNSHVAEPLSRALDAVFGGNPVDEVDNIIDDTVKNGKEGENE